MATLTTTLNTMIPPVARLKATINGVVVELTKTQDTTTTYHWANTGSTFTIKWTNNGTATKGELYNRTFTIEWDSITWGNSPIFSLAVYSDECEIRTITLDGDFTELSGTFVLTDDTGVNVVYSTFATHKLTNVLYWIGIGCFYNGSGDNSDHPCTFRNWILQFDSPSIYFPGEMAA